MSDSAVSSVAANLPDDTDRRKSSAKESSRILTPVVDHTRSCASAIAYLFYKSKLRGP
jgi:hypothetical protein